MLEAVGRPARRRDGLRAGAGALPAPGPLGAGARRRTLRPAGSARSTRWSAASGTSSAAVAFEVELAALVGAASAGEETYEDVTTFPAVYQDLAVVVPAEVAAAEVRAAVLAGGGELLRSAEVFDLYQGEQLGEDRKSLALRLEFRAADRTLTDEEVAGLRDAIEAELEKIGGSLRD